jgi:hypothetical protein
MQGYKQFLDKENLNKSVKRIKVTKVKYVGNKIIIHLMSDYIALYYKYVTIGKNGTAKVLTKVCKNYHAKNQYTTYEDVEGKEITRKQYSKLQ